MKNVFFIINDSMRFEAIGDGRWGDSATPFIDTLKDKAVFAKNLYSQGPYTEAAIKCLLSGRDLLSDGGYLFRLHNTPYTVFETIKQNGYEIYYTASPDLLYSQKTLAAIDHIIYAGCPNFIDFYTYRVEYYLDLLKKGKCFDREKMIALFEIEFKQTIHFYESYTQNQDAEAFVLIKNQLKKRDVAAILSAWKAEYRKFIQNKNAYIDNVIKYEKQHLLYKITEHLWALETDGSVMQKMYKKNQKFFEICLKFQKRMNFKNGIRYFKLFKSLLIRIKQKVFNEKLENFHTSNYFANWHHMSNNDWKSLLLFPEKARFEVWPSMKKQIDFFVSQLIDRKEKDKPFFIVMHTLNAHYLNAMLSYDIDDEYVLQNEIDVLKDDFEKLSKHFCGYLSYRQAIRYIDYYTEYLFSELEKNGLLHNTIVSFSSDHGSSFGPSYVREEPKVNNQYMENYHIPFFAYDGETICDTEEMATSKDIFPTLFEMAGIEKGIHCTGHSLLTNMDTEIVHSEYLGPGCPDLMEKKIRYVGRTKKYAIAYECFLSDDFDKGIMISCFDIEHDKNELNNLVNKIPQSIYENILLYLKRRHNELRREYNCD